MIEWRRPAVDPLRTWFCAVVEYAGRSTVTACRGRWETSEADTVRAEVPEAERCGGCERELERIEERERSRLTVALRRSIAARLLPMNLAELAEVDATVTDLERRRGQ